MSQHTVEILSAARALIDTPQKWRQGDGGTGRRPDTNVATFPSGSMIVISSSVAI